MLYKWHHTTCNLWHTVTLKGGSPHSRSVGVWILAPIRPTLTSSWLKTLECLLNCSLHDLHWPWWKGSKAFLTGSDESPDSPLGSSDLPTLLQRSRGGLLCYWHLWVEVQTCHVGPRDTAGVPCAYPVGMRILSPFSNFSASSSKGYRSTSLASQNGRLSSLLCFLWYECEWAYCLICLVGASDFCLNFIFARLSFLRIKLLVWLFVCSSIPAGISGFPDYLAPF